MSPLLRKEIRLILPFWGIALALGVIPVFALPMSEWWHVGDGCFWLFAFGLTLLGLAPFGQEFGWGTFSIMLAQPLERRRIWKTKFFLALAAGAIVFLLFALSVHVQLAANLRAQVQSLTSNHQFDAARMAEMRGSEFLPSVIKGFVLLLMAVAGGLWTTLLFRQTGAALWFAILIPGVLVVIVEGIFHTASTIVTDIAVYAILFLYAIAGFACAWRMLARAQDSQWLGETVATFSLKSSRAEVVSDKPRRKGAFRALLRKEFQSHQISFLIAFGLLVLHVCTLIFRHIFQLPVHSELRLALEAVPFLWLLIPWLMGCVAVAEERKLGTLESQLCLPVTRRLQFIIKVAVVLILGVIIGGFMPGIIEAVGRNAGISSAFLPLPDSPDYPWLMDLELYPGVIALQIGALLIGLVSLFASSLTRNTLHALGTAIVFGMAWVFFFNWEMFQAGQGYNYSLWKGPLMFFVGAGLSILVTIGLSFSNYKRLHTGGRVWLRNVAILAGTLAFAGFATAVIYQRPWELMMTLEPQHGARVLSGPVRPALAMPGGRICALLPDGRIWISAAYHMQFMDQPQDPWNDGQNYWSGKTAVPDNGTFVGSNWVALAANDDAMEVEAIRSDGTLWSLFSPSIVSNWRSPSRRLDLKPNPSRIGADSDWKKVVAVGGAFIALKSDGTLWQWGDYAAADHRIVPYRVGADSDWENIFAQQWGPVLVKRDGSVWISPQPGQGPILSRFVRTKLNGADWLDVSGQNDVLLVIKRDGTLWEAILPFGIYHFRNGSDWNAISGWPVEFVAVKGGGLLNSGYVPFTQSLGRPSRYSDWLAVDVSHDRMLALAADGTLSLWFDMPAWHRGAEWLARCRRPFWTLNILTNAKN